MRRCVDLAESVESSLQLVLELLIPFLKFLRAWRARVSTCWSNLFITRRILKWTNVFIWYYLQELIVHLRKVTQPLLIIHFFECVIINEGVDGITRLLQRRRAIPLFSLKFLKDANLIHLGIALPYLLLFIRIAIIN